MSALRNFTTACLAIVLSGPAVEAGAAPAERTLKVEVDKSHALDDHRIVVRMSRPPGKVQITVTSEKGDVIVDREDDFTGRPAGAPLVVTWEQEKDQPVASIELRMEDHEGNYIRQTYSAWYVPIPHEEVNFRTDSSEVDASEVAKLDGAFAKIEEVLAKDQARDHKNLTLYVAGHTDTVGNAGYNIKLSQARAQSLARWFRQRGVRIPIAYEGFGESALLVSTPDQTPEARNRRADYIIADAPPPVKSTGYHANWKRLN